MRLRRTAAVALFAACVLLAAVYRTDGTALPLSLSPSAAADVSNAFVAVDDVACSLMVCPSVVHAKLLLMAGDLEAAHAAAMAAAQAHPNGQTWAVLAEVLAKRG